MTLLSKLWADRLIFLGYSYLKPAANFSLVEALFDGLHRVTSVCVPTQECRKYLEPPLAGCSAIWREVYCAGYCKTAQLAEWEWASEYYILCPTSFKCEFDILETRLLKAKFCFVGSTGTHGKRYLQDCSWQLPNRVLLLFVNTCLLNLLQTELRSLSVNGTHQVSSFLHDVIQWLWREVASVDERASARILGSVHCLWIDGDREGQGHF